MDVLIVGGGKGISQTVRALLDFRPKVIVSTLDSGGSTGRIRKILRVPAMGDIRRVLDVSSPNGIGRTMEKRIDGHALGNLVLAYFILEYGLEEAIRKYSSLVEAPISLAPLTHEPADLVALFEDGRVVFGEDPIDKYEGRIKKLWVEPRVNASGSAIAFAEEAEVLVIGPGSIYTSLLPHFLLPELRKKLAKIPLKIYVANAFNDAAPTKGFRLSDYLKVLEEFVEPDYILAASDGEVEIDIKSDRILSSRMLSGRKHDPEKLREAILSLLKR